MLDGQVQRATLHQLAVLMSVLCCRETVHLSSPVNVDRERSKGQNERMNEQLSCLKR